MVRLIEADFRLIYKFTGVIEEKVCLPDCEKGPVVPGCE